MKAVVYQGPRDIQVEDIVPPHIAADEMLVQVHTCSICGSGLTLYRLSMITWTSQ
jgi:threonine dehydrogenase-like Zn-dependent dehydrogenase